MDILAVLNEMTLFNKVMLGMFALAIIILVSKLLKKEESEFDKVYEKVLTSKEYQVKGRFE